MYILEIIFKKNLLIFYSNKCSIHFYRLAFKVVITSTAVYWTNQLEVWSTLSSKDRAYDQILSCAKAMVAKNTPDSLKFQVSRTIAHLNQNSDATIRFHFAVSDFRCKRLKMTNSFYALQQITITIKVWWAHSQAFPTYQAQSPDGMTWQLNNWMLQQQRKRLNRTV